MAVPKRKVSKARRDKRRSSVWKLEVPGLVECPQCHELKKPHVVCPSCGYYNGKEVLKDGKLIKAEVKTEEADKKTAKSAKTTTKSATKATAEKKTTTKKASPKAKKEAKETKDTAEA